MKQRLALAAISALVGLLIAEAVSRLPGIDPGYARLLAGDEPGPEAARGAIRTVDGVPLWQHQNPRAGPEDIARAAAAHDAFTVLGLGDSIMYGVLLAKEQTYLEQMRRALAGRVARRIEVVNLAVPGYNTLQEDAVDRELGDRLSPNLVLLHYWSDDGRLYRAVGGYVLDLGWHTSPDGHLTLRAIPLSPSINDFLLLHSHLYQLLTHVLISHDRRLASDEWSRVAEPLVALNERVRHAGGRLVVLASPNLAADAIRANQELPLLRQLAAEHGFEVVDLGAWLDGVPAATIRQDECHFNAEGHRLIGEHLAEYLLGHDLQQTNEIGPRVRGVSR